MNDQVIVSFPKQIGKEKKAQLSEQLNKALEKIRYEVNNWNGFVDLAQTDKGYYQLIAKCDNEAVLQKMQQLINERIGEEIYFSVC